MARLGADGRFGDEQQEPRRHRHLAMAELFRPSAAIEGYQARPRRLPQARSENRTRAREGRRPLHDLHHFQAHRPPPPPPPPHAPAPPPPPPRPPPRHPPPHPP